MSPAFYMVPPMDRPQENVIYINGGKSSYDTYTLLAHEGSRGICISTNIFGGRRHRNFVMCLIFPHIRKGGQPMWKSLLSV